MTNTGDTNLDNFESIIYWAHRQHMTAHKGVCCDRNSQRRKRFAWVQNGAKTHKTVGETDMAQ